MTKTIAESASMKLRYAITGADGKIKKTSKTYNNIQKDITDDNFVAFAQKIAKVQLYDATYEKTHVKELQA